MNTESENNDSHFMQNGYLCSRARERPALPRAVDQPEMFVWRGDSLQPRTWVVGGNHLPRAFRDDVGSPPLPPLLERKPSIERSFMGQTACVVCLIWVMMG